MSLKHTHMARHWGLLLSLGILFILLGMAGFGMTFALTMVSMFALGMLFIVGGVFQLFDAIKSRRWNAGIWHAIIGGLYLAGGCLIIYDPILASILITMFLAWIFILIGVLRCVMAYTLRHSKSWIFCLFSGLISMILGVLILLQWPLSGLWIIGLFIAIELIIAGWTYVLLAFGMKTSL